MPQLASLQACRLASLIEKQTGAKGVSRKGAKAPGESLIAIQLLLVCAVLFFATLRF
jgi:hypothetical protein